MEKSTVIQLPYPYAQLRKFGLNSTQIGRLKHHLDNMYNASGPVFVVNRIKAIRSWFLQGQSGLVGLPGIAFKNGIPKGPISVLFTGRKNVRSILDILTLLYTRYVSHSVTVYQWEKFSHSVERPVGPDIFIPFLEEATSELTLPDYPSLTYRDYPFDGTRRVPDSRDCSGLNTIEMLKEDFRTKCVRDMLDDSASEYVISDVLDDLYIPLIGVEEDSPTCHVGRIGCIQERGMKARFIAVPRLTFQVALRNLGKYLFQILRSAPWDCTFDQKKGVRWAKEQLLSGKRLYSVDISDASNNMPLSSTERVMRWLECSYQDIKLFDNCSRGTWAIPRYIRNCIDVKKRNVSKHPEYLQWTQGQPLGLYPSFPAFALWHGCVLRSIELRYSLSDTFMVLGDDVVISNPLTHWAYRRLMDRLTVPVNITKTIVGSDIGEFAGHTVTRKSSFLVKKAIVPTRNNLCYRAFLRTQGDLKKITSVDELVAFAHHTAQPDFENQAGISSYERALVANVLGSEETLVPITVSNESKHLYNKLCSVLSRTDIVDSRSRIDQEFSFLWKSLEVDQPERVVSPMQRLIRTLRCTGVMETLLPIDVYQRCHMELNRADENFDPIGLFKKGYNDSINSSLFSRMKRSAYRRQLLSFKKSKSLVISEIADILMKSIWGV